MLMQRACARNANSKSKKNKIKRRTNMNKMKASLQPTDYRPRDVEPVLTFSALAWLKLQYFCHAGESEIGGFGISAADEHLYIEDFVTVQQIGSMATVEFADSAVADYFDACVDAGLTPEQFARVWIHT